MMDFYLKFQSEDEFRAIAHGLNLIDDEENLKLGDFEFRIDVIGSIEGVNGLHVNWRQLDGELPSVLTPHLIQPANPVRGFL